MSAIYRINIETDTLQNTNFRKVLATSGNQQLVVMNLKPKEDIPMEIHHNVDQFFRIEKGKGKVLIGKSGNEEYELSDGIIIMIPAGTWHRIINTSTTEDLKLYTIYSPPNHPPNKIEISRPEDQQGGVHLKYLKYKQKYMNLKDNQKRISIQNPPETPWLDWIISGKKKYEGRVPRLGSFWADIRIGDEFILYDKNNPKELKIKVNDLKHYKNFGEAWKDLGSALVPIKGITETDVNKIYSQYYTKEDIDKYGVIAIGVQPILIKNLSVI